MVATTSDELAIARSWIGSIETSDIFDGRFDRNYRLVTVTSGMTDAVRRARALNLSIEESLRSQLADFRQDPAQMSADGNSVGTSANIVSLEKDIKEFRLLRGTGQAGVTRLRRYHGR